MTEEERKRYFSVLVENLYSKLQIVAEGTVQNKNEIASRMIYNFYEKHKDNYGIENIEEVFRELNRVDNNMKKERGKKEEKEQPEK